MRVTLNVLAMTLGLALAACSGDSSTGTSGGTTGGGTTGGTTSGGGTTGGVSSDTVAACSSFCSHELTCLNPGANTGGCSAACSNYQTYYSGAATCTDWKALFNCLGGLPCSDFSGSPNPSDFSNCATQGGCH
jgi:hypothetical protein